MKNLILLSLLLLIAGCSHIKYVEVPVETVKTEYINKEKTDSIFIHVTDSSVTIERGDTIILEKYRTVWKDKYIYTRDTVIQKDTIPKIQKVVEVQEVNKLKTWQVILMCLGGLGIGYLIYKIVRLIKK